MCVCVCMHGCMYACMHLHPCELFYYTDAPNILILCYEDMIKKPKTMTEKVAKFLGQC